MKRSDLVYKLADMLELHFGKEIKTYIAGAVLAFLEEKGMQPPDYFNPNKGGFVGSPMGTWENEWEPE